MEEAVYKAQLPRRRTHVDHSAALGAKVLDDLEHEIAVFFLGVVGLFSADGRLGACLNQREDRLNHAKGAGPSNPRTVSVSGAGGRRSVPAVDDRWCAAALATRSSQEHIDRRKRSRHAVVGPRSVVQLHDVARRAVSAESKVPLDNVLRH